MQEGNNIYQFKIRSAENTALNKFMKLNNTSVEVKSVYDPNTSAFSDETVALNLGMSYSDILT